MISRLKTQGKQRFSHIPPARWYAGPEKIFWTFPGSEGISGNSMISPKFSGEFPEFFGFSRKIPEIPGIPRNFTGFSRDFSEFSEKYGISGISEIFDSRPAGSRPSSRRKFSNKFRGFLKISWAPKNVTQNPSDSLLKILRENFLQVWTN